MVPRRWGWPGLWAVGATFAVAASGCVDDPHRGRVGRAEADAVLAGDAAGRYADATPPRRTGVVDLELRLFGTAANADACLDLRVTGGAGVVWSVGDPTVNAIGNVQASANASAVPAPARDAGALCDPRPAPGGFHDTTLAVPCDAEHDTSDAPGIQNDVTVWLDGFYRDGALVGPYANPCANGCTLRVDCREGEHVPARVDLVLSADDRQGFMPSTELFDEAWCVATLKGCADVRMPGETAGTPVTAIGMTCTGTDDPARRTEIALAPIVLTCASGGAHIDPSTPNDTWVSARVAPAAPDASPGTDDLHYLVHAGSQASRPSLAETWATIAFDLRDLTALGGDCRLSWSATAIAPDHHIFDDRGVDAHALVYPFVGVDTALTEDGQPTCLSEASLDHGDLATAYRGTMLGMEAPPERCAGFDGTRWSASAAPACRASAP